MFVQHFSQIAQQPDKAHHIETKSPDIALAALNQFVAHQPAVVAEIDRDHGRVTLKGGGEVFFGATTRPASDFATHVLVN